MIRRLWRYLFGYVIIKIKGARPERFLNRAARAGIWVWDTERLSTGMLVACVSLSGFRKVRALCRAQGWQVTIAQKVGLPFFIASLRRRKMLVAGGFLFIAALYTASSYVWFVEVDSIPELPRKRILEAAASAGLRPGVLRYEVDPHEVQKTLLLSIDEISWASVTLQGTRAIIHAAERAGGDAGRYSPGDVVAARDGIVQRVVPFHGYPVVEAGDTVREGDLLISGFVPPLEGAHRELLELGSAPYVRAYGIVRARVWYEGVASVRLQQIDEEPTGRTRRTVWLGLGEWSWKLGRGPDPITAYRTEERTWALTLPGGWDVQLSDVRYHEVRRTAVSVDRAVAEQEALEAARSSLEALLPSGVTVISDPEESVELIEASPAPMVRAVVRVEVVEDIAKFRELQF